MALNGCSKKNCPLQVGTADNCNLTKEQCPYFTQDIDYHRVLKQIKVDVAKKIFEDIEQLFIDGCETYYTIEPEDYYKLKNKYTGEKEDAEIH